MASRLSDEAIKSSYERGLRGVAVRRVKKLPDLIRNAAANLDELLSRENVEEAVQAVEPVAMYRAIMAKGPADALDVLPYLSADQVTRIMDYEAWHENRLEPLRAINWLMLFNELGPTDMFNRLKEQEEEFQLALLGPYIEMVDEEEFEKIPDHERDEWIALPCHTLFYRIKSDDPRVQKFVETLVGSGLEADLQYTYSLLSHAGYVPPAEQEAMLAQFRQARLEEDGIVAYEESMHLFARIDLAKLKKQWCPDGDRAASTDLTVAASASDNAFLLRVLARLSEHASPDAVADLTRSMVHTANMICTATGTEVGEESQLRDLMYNMQSLVSLGLEWLSEGDVNEGARLLTRIHPQQLFRAGLTLVAGLCDEVIAALKTVPLIEAEAIGRMWQRDRRGALIHWLEVNQLDLLGFERLEFLKGLFNRFPMFFTSQRTEGRQRIEFQPVISLDDLQELRVQAVAFMEHVRLFVNALEAPIAGLTIDKVLATATARACLQGQFIADPLTVAEIRILEAFSQEKLGKAFGECTTALAERIRSSVTGSGNTAEVARAVADRVVSSLSDIYFDLVSGLKSLDAESPAGELTTGAFSSIVLLDSQNKEPSHHA
jgi:hypothetical protein